MRACVRACERAWVCLFEKKMQVVVGETRLSGVLRWNCFFSGHKGVHFFSLTNRSDSETKCLEWWAAEKLVLVETKRKFEYSSACPCDLQLAASDGLWTFDWRTFVSNPASKTLCYYELKTASNTSQVSI